MLKLAENADIQRIIDFSRIQPIGVKISCQSLAYGLEGKMFSVWMQLNDDGKITALFADFCGNCTLISASNADFEEISLFVSSSNFSSLCGDSKTFEICGISCTVQKKLLEYKGEINEYPQVKDDGNIRSAYNLVSASIPNSFRADEESYLDFLSDFTYRRNRNLARTRIIENDNEVLSCCFTAAEDEGRGLISAVATNENTRGKGYGRMTVQTMASSLKKESKRPYVIALNDSACGFYKNIGFEQVGTICFK